MNGEQRIWRAKNIWIKMILKPDDTPKTTLRVALKRLTLSVIEGRHPNGLRYAHIFDGIKKPRK